MAAGVVGSGRQRSPFHALSWSAPSTWHAFPLPTSLLLGTGSGATSPPSASGPAATPTLSPGHSLL